MEILELENIIPETYQDLLLERVTSNKFPWYFNPNLVTDELLINNKDINHIGFNHFLLEGRIVVSNQYDIFAPLVAAIEKHIPGMTVMERMRLNHTQTSSVDNLHHLPHTDSTFPHINAIYYVNDSDGDTFIFEEKTEDFEIDATIDTMMNASWTTKHRCTPKKGKVLIFQGDSFHASSFCKQSPYRIVVNMNFGFL